MLVEVFMEVHACWGVLVRAWCIQAVVMSTACGACACAASERARDGLFVIRTQAVPAARQQART